MVIFQIFCKTILKDCLHTLWLFISCFHFLAIEKKNSHQFGWLECQEFVELVEQQLEFMVLYYKCHT